MEEKNDVSRVEKLYGAYRFRIEGFSGLPNRIGDSVESPEFTLCGHTWQLRIFPGGSLDQHKGYVSFYLASKSTRIARASYKLVLINHIMGGQDEAFASSGIRIFEAKGIQIDGWGRDKFIALGMLQDPSIGFCVDDVVIFKVELTVHGDLQPVVSPHFASVVPNSLNSLGDCLRRLLTDGIATDVTFSINIVEGRSHKLYAHKCVLIARSEVFRAMFNNGMSEASTGEIEISDLECCVVSEMLHFMYTDAFTSEKALSIHGVGLLVAAFKYRVVGLMATCEDYFCSQLSDDNVVNTLRLADTYNAVDLRQRTIQYIAQHSSQRITLSKEWRDLDEELRDAATVAIGSATKRLGYRRSGLERERRFYDTCIVM